MEKVELSSRILCRRQFYSPSKRYDLNTQPATGRLSRINLGDPRRDEKPRSLIEYFSILFPYPLFVPCLLFTAGLINLILVFNRVNNCRYVRQSLLSYVISSFEIACGSKIILTVYKKNIIISLKFLENEKDG